MRKSHPGYEKCRLCGDFYMNLDRHQIEEHDMTEKCPVCGMRFESSWGLRPHYQQKNDHPNESIPEIREKDVPQMNE